MPKPVIAIVGINGFLGAPVLKQLISSKFESNFSLPIKVITRDASKNMNTESVKYVEVNELDAGKYAEAFKGVDVIINLTGSPDVLDTLAKALQIAKPKLYIPSQFGTLVEAGDKVIPGVLDYKTKHSEAVRRAGIKTVDISTSLFFVPDAFLYEFIGNAGYDTETNDVTYYGDENTRFGVSSLIDIAKVVAILVSKENYEDIPNNINIYSDITTQKEIVEVFERKHPHLAPIKRLPNIPLDVAIEEVKKEFSAGFSMEAFMKYLQVLSASGEGKGLAFFENNHREYVNPNESVFAWTRYP